MKKSKSKHSRDLKIIIVGDSGTGKTSFVNRYILNKFAGNYQATIATQFSSKILQINDITYRLQFWDIAGQDRNVATTNIFCKNANGIVLCSEINDKRTLENTDLLGNESEYNKDVEELKEFGKKNGVVNCFRTSALNGYGIKECMDFLIKEIIKVTDFTDIESEENNADNFDISDEPRSIRGKNSGCC